MLFNKWEIGGAVEEFEATALHLDHGRQKGTRRSDRPITHYTQVLVLDACYEEMSQYLLYCAMCCSCREIMPIDTYDLPLLSILI